MLPIVRVLLAMLSLVVGCAVAGAPPPPSPVVEPVAAPPPAQSAAVVAAPGSDDGGPIPVTASDPSRGNTDALVTVVEFGDLADPFVARAAAELRELEKRYPPDQLRIVWKHFPAPHHAHAKPAAVAAQAAFLAGGSSAFWAFHDAALAAGQRMDPAEFDGWAATAGAPMAGYRQAKATGEAQRKVEDDMALGEMRRVVVAPWFFVNGVECSTRTRCTAFAEASRRHISTVIDVEIAKARMALTGGVLPKALYVEMVRRNAANPPEVPEPPPAANPPARETFGAKHLVVMYAGSLRAPKSISRTKEQARARAVMAVRKARQKGVAFEEVVLEFSDEPGAAQRGGDLGFFPRTAMVPEFQAGVEALTVGEISDVVETPFGFHVILRTK